MAATRLPKMEVPFPLGRGYRNTPIPEYEVVMQGEDGQIYEQRYQCPWSTEKDFVTLESIAKACSAQAFMSQGKGLRFAPISASLA